MNDRGSEWRKWDLHVHTASSYDHDYKHVDSDKLLATAWQSNEIAAVAITDHFIIDRKRIEHLQQLAPSVTVFPGVELRTDKGATNLHVIVIFSNKTNLKELEEDFNSILLRGKAKEGEDIQNMVRDFNDIVKFAESHKGIISIHAGKKSNGVDDVITNTTPVALAVKTEISDYVHIYELGQERDIEDYRNIVFKSLKREYPLIICSDNHDPRHYELKTNLWIKADTTFEGLVQSLLHPTERFFIGARPKKLDVIDRNKRVYIDCIQIKRIDNPKNSAYNWFDSTVSLNSGLVVIIGNKGSGKSALSDIIGHLCKCTSMENASFLEKERFKRGPEHFANDYDGCITWLDAKAEKSNLGMSKYETSIENAKYLPQRYIEKVCTDLNDEFQREIDSLIFSYIDEAERGSALNLDELIANRAAVIFDKIDELHNDLNRTNANIIKCEDRLTGQYRKTLEDNLNKRKEDLQRHDASKPKEVKVPESTKNEASLNRINEIDIAIQNLEHTERECKEKLGSARESLQKISLFTSLTDDITRQIKAYNEKLLTFYDEFQVHEKDIIIMPELQSKIDSVVSKQESERDKFAKLLGLGINEKSTKEEREATLPYKISVLNSEKQSLLNVTTNHEREYQKYLDDLRMWEKQRSDIVGTENTPNSIVSLAKELDFVNTKLPAEYSSLVQRRSEVIHSIFSQKELLVKVYEGVYAPVENEIARILGDIDDKIQFSVNVTLTNRELGREILEFINQGAKGIFQGKTEGNAAMESFIQDTSFDNPNSILMFIDNVLQCIHEDLDGAHKKVKDRTSFYSKITKLDYIDVRFSLQLGGRSLQDLSAGERGIVLLVFYLALNRNDIPLIIDQPEDNLDNQSVYAKLVPCIKSAKSRRQVIIVTHNPNIAIACDAEQIIYCNVNKKDSIISYSSSSIENSLMRKNVVDVLEGTMKAFDLRRQKYTHEYLNEII